MGYEIVAGRNAEDKKKHGTMGCVLLGKHYVKMGQTSSLSNDVFLDVTRSHVVFLCGKRGSGKSYTMASMAEGIADLPEDIKKNIAVLIIDTMGIFWTMKYPNEPDRELLEQWDQEPHGLDVEVWVPEGRYQGLIDAGIPADKPFAINPADIAPGQWSSLFGIDSASGVGALLEQTADALSEHGKFSLDEFAHMIENSDAQTETRRAAKNLVTSADNWGLFSENGTKIEDLVSPGKVSILDVSTYATQTGTWNVRALVIGLVAQRLFASRMAARREEEHKALKEELAFQGGGEQAEPVIWLMIDEAHEFLPREGKTPATDALVTLLREARQPGISLVLATQQPGKIHTDVMTQSDVVIAHRITAKIDTDALQMLTQSYMRGNLDLLLNELPRVKGAAIVLDDNNEKLYSIRVRPRFSWHGGSDPDALRGK